MHIRITRYTTSQAVDEASLARGAENMSSTFGQTAGYLGWAALVDQAGSKAIVATYWADADAMQASEDAGAAQRGQQEGAQVTDVERYEFLVQERLAPPAAGTFIRLTDLALAPERIDDLVSSVRTVTVPLAKAQSGFRSFLVAANRGAGKVVIASVWESAAARETSDTAFREERRRTMERVGASLVNVGLYEMVHAEIKLPTPA